MNSLAAATEGFAGADLQALCTSAVIAAVHRANPDIIEAADTLSSGSLPQELASLKVFQSLSSLARTSNFHCLQLIPFHVLPLTDSSQERWPL